MTIYVKKFLYKPVTGLVLKSFHNGADSSATFGENLPSWFTAPMNLQSSVMFVGGDICFMADNFYGSAEISLSVMTWPRKVMELFVNSHFDALTSIYWNNDGIQNGR